ncbi:hypothetical protein OSB04_014176 [Centaurea solstitialis]|uniref:Glutaredoxin domain-containing protein n=1 Tax=Centaurea solstitialis TaxID=347529 RepID=A0AA38WIY0_9ASTR|nr:hypothetical protein OSB04_014176 [Centaurea solstitialis]
MQQAIPYKAWTALPLNQKESRLAGGGGRKPSSRLDGSATGAGAVRDAVTENAVIVVARRGCCMSHVVKRLLNGHGVNPSVFEFEEEEEEDVVKELETMLTMTMIKAEKDDVVERRRVQFPAVFIGGRLFGGLDRVMATHITGELIPVLKQAGALWL